MNYEEILYEINEYHTKLLNEPVLAVKECLVMIIRELTKLLSQSTDTIE